MVPIVIKTRDKHHERPHIIEKPIKIVERPIFFQPCERHERWYKCLPNCPITCKNLRNSTCIEPMKICKQGCECKSGFARQHPHSKCRPVEFCQGECLDIWESDLVAEVGLNFNILNRHIPLFMRYLPYFIDFIRVETLRKFPFSFDIRSVTRRMHLTKI